MHFKAEIPLLVVLMCAWVSSQECGNIEFTEYRKTFTSPNYPRRYDHEADCTWTIKAPENHFIKLSFDMETFDVKNPFWKCSEDYVLVVDSDSESEKFCNDNAPPPIIRSSSNQLIVKLKSDIFFMNGVGFTATYNIVDSTGKTLAGDEEEEVESDEAKGPSVGKIDPLDKPYNLIHKDTDADTEILVKPSNSVVDEKKMPLKNATDIKSMARKGKKGKKGGKKQKKSKEERRKERKLRRQKEKALRRKNKKGKGRKGKKTGAAKPINL